MVAFGCLGNFPMSMGNHIEDHLVYRSISNFEVREVVGASSTSALRRIFGINDSATLNPKRARHTIFFSIGCQLDIQIQRTKTQHAVESHIAYRAQAPSS